MIGRRGFLRRSLGWLFGGVALKTLNGQAIGRLPAPDYILLHWIPRKEGDHPAYIGTRAVKYLSDAGKAAWDRGEDLDFNKGHFLTRNACFIHDALDALEESDNEC